MRSCSVPRAFEEVGYLDQYEFGGDDRRRQIGRDFHRAGVECVAAVVEGDVEGGVREDRLHVFFGAPYR